MTINHLVEPLLEKFTLDFNSEVSFEDQKKAGMKSLRKACLNFLEQAKIDRRARIEHAKERHLKDQVQRVKDREECFARIDEANCHTDEIRFREEEKEVSYKIMGPYALLSLQCLLHPMARNRRGGAATKRSRQPSERTKSPSSTRISMQEPVLLKRNVIMRLKSM
jgi:hypothetical protein